MGPAQITQQREWFIVSSESAGCLHMHFDYAVKNTKRANTHNTIIPSNNMVFFILPLWLDWNRLTETYDTNMKRAKWKPNTLVPYKHRQTGKMRIKMKREFIRMRGKTFHALHFSYDDTFHLKEQPNTWRNVESRSSPLLIVLRVGEKYSLTLRCLGTMCSSRRRRLLTELMCPNVSPPTAESLFAHQQLSNPLKVLSI